MSSSSSSLLGIVPADLVAFCTRHHITRLAVFGSTLKGTATATSDVDVLVHFDPAHVPGLLALATMEAELSDLLGGRRADIRTPADLSRHFRDEVLKTAHVEYAA